MRLYSAASEEALRAGLLLKDWAREGFLSEAQYQQMKEETVCDLRRTNIFLRLVLFLFALVITVAAAWLFFLIFLSRPSAQTTGVFLLIFAAISYAAAEFAVVKGRLYRYGIEEALAACSVGFLCAGLKVALSSNRPYSAPSDTGFLVPAAATVLSLWIWRRFGLFYAFLSAMIFLIFLPGHWTSSHAAQHLIVAALYATGLASVAAVRSRHRFDYLNQGYSLIEAFLWLGVYLAFNLQLSSWNQPAHWWGVARAGSEFSTPFYWTTWVLTWCLPPAILWRGVRQKDRFVMAAGAIVTTLTLVTNKPYLGWPRHTWDPMLLGIFLIGVALFLRRWLASQPGLIRHGFTAARVSAKDKDWVNSGSAVFGLLLPHSITPAPQTASPDVRFGGGDFGGGGASSDF